MKIDAGAEIVSVDIATRVVGTDEDIFVIQPGRSFWLYEHFLRRGYVFLDFPALFDNLPSQAPPTDEVLRRMIVRSEAFETWFDLGSKGPPPSSDLNDYIGKDKRRRLGRYVGAIKRLYWDIQVGTIVVVPGKHYDDDVMIGEISDETHVIQDDLIYGGAPLLARKVKWRNRKPKSAFSKKMRERFGTPNPLTLLDRSLRVEVLRAGFEQYAFEGEFTSRLNTTAAGFTSVDDYDIQTFVNYVCGILAAIDKGYTTELSFDDAISLLRADRGAAVDLNLNINSPGFQRLVDDTIKPLVIGVLLSVATVGQGHAADAPMHVEISNSEAAENDPCTVQVSKRVEEAMQLMMLEEWIKVCKNARAAHKATGLATNMRVKNKGKATP